ncbi:hypothetical protein PG999_008146 [Apiospora kogelbergensis]|uniref:Uncharacterized protein n=1 Tax=Apiospora kogelbergensis TaxID=1337665 RepID=A0AAW0QPX9_9PEZI
MQAKDDGRRRSSCRLMPKSTSNSDPTGLERMIVVSRPESDDGKSDHAALQLRTEEARTDDRLVAVASL